MVCEADLEATRRRDPQIERSAFCSGPTTGAEAGVAGAGAVCPPQGESIRAGEWEGETDVA